MSAQPTPLARRVLANAATWTCAHPRRPLRLYQLPGLKEARLCVLCAFELGDRLGFQVSSDQVIVTIERLRITSRSSITGSTLEFFDIWLDHVEDCEQCECAENALEMCRGGQRIFLERAIAVKWGEA